MYLRVVFAVRPSLLYSVSQRVIKRPPASDSTIGVSLKYWVSCTSSDLQIWGSEQARESARSTSHIRIQTGSEVCNPHLENKESTERSSMSSFPSHASVWKVRAASHASWAQQKELGRERETWLGSRLWQVVCSLSAYASSSSNKMGNELIRGESLQWVTQRGAFSWLKPSRK